MSLGTVLVTGASGFSASHLALGLRAAGVTRIIGISRTPQRAGADLPWDGWRIVNPCDAKAVRALVRNVRPNHIFHLAGTPTGSEAEVFEACVGSARNLLNAVRDEAPDCGVLLVGSAAEYGYVSDSELPARETQLAAPVSVYGRAKLAATAAALQFTEAGGKAVVVRPFNLVGAGVPTSLVVGALIERLLDAVEGRTSTMPVGRMETKRDFLAIEDAVFGYIGLVRNGCWGTVVNLCSGKPTAIGAIVDALVAIANSPVTVLTDPALMRADDVLVNYGSWERAHALIGFTPRTPLSEALQSAWCAAVARRSGSPMMHTSRRGMT